MELDNIGGSGRRRSIADEILHEDEEMVYSDRDIGDHHDDDELELQWAAIQRLPTFERIRTSLFDKDKDVSNDGRSNKRRIVDVRKLGNVERHLFIDSLIKKVEEDNHRLLQKFKERIDRVGIDLPTVEVRYKNLSVKVNQETADGKPLQALWNTFKSIFSGWIINSGNKHEGNKVTILKDVNGILKPSRMTLLLGPPGCGKTTLLQALAGKSEESLMVTGDISYNGYMLNEFVPQKTSAYISQYDQHITEMTVRETLDFAARCQGVGGREDMMREISKKEKQAGITPKPDIDTYMKAISTKGLKKSLQTDYILKILGLDFCADTIVGDAMIRGISGGQKKRLTTGEMIIGPARALFMDEISTGLDSSTTFQIVKCLQQIAHVTDSTILVSLLQPAPETFDLFDDVILMAEGQIVYHGPRASVLEFFERCGFRCPQRKGIADFLQEVVSKKDQAQYWWNEDRPYSFVSIDYFAEEFKECPIGTQLKEELSRPFDRTKEQKNALSFDRYSLTKWELFKACLAREWLLMKRNSFVHVFKSAQLVFLAVVSMTLFIRSRMKLDAAHATLYMSSMFYALIRLMVNGVQELGMTVSRLRVFYKHRDYYFYPAWAYAIPAAILKIPFSMLDAFLWTALTYYVIGYSPEPQRFFSQFLVLFLVHQVAISQFRLVASTVRNPSIAATVSLFSLLLIFLFGGFVIPKPSLPVWLHWGFWLSPLSYAEIGASLNEFLAPRWQKLSSSNVTLGHQVLQKRGLNFSSYYYWISVLALVGFWLVYNIGFNLALTFAKTPQRSQTAVSRKDGKNMAVQKQGSRKVAAEKTRGMVLPFEPTTLTFENLQYYVDTPQKLREKGFPERRLQLLQDITGVFRPGVLTALMGVSGAGKTTLMDVLSGRKTGGVIEGEIKVGGYPKVQATYARISGYCEQTDIHSPQLTIEESVMYSAWLRLPAEIDKHTRVEFVNEVLQMIELDNIKDAVVGIAGMGGISTEQCKRLTIAVELVSNPSIIFMDEPTSGLDARAAAIVMRVVKNIVHTGRTIVCTIHQPSIDIFEAFDELILLKRGGQMIYAGDLGEHSSKLISYFESIQGAPKIKENYNPSTWMLEITTQSMEAELGIDFATIYKESHLFRINEQLVGQFSSPSGNSKELFFPTKFPQSKWEQFKACLWKQHLSYWRSPQYNLGRMAFICVSSLVFGALLWQKGQTIKSEQDFFNVLGAMYIFLQFTGISNCASVMPFIATERIVIYREMFAGMYSSWAYTLAQVAIELPYVLLQAFLFVVITYPAVGFHWSFYKVFWYSYTSFCTMLYFNYLGMMLVSLTPSYQVATIVASLCYTMFSIFAGYLIPQPKIPGWWVWCYWICPTAWSLKGLLTSQYGDINNQITVYGESTTIKGFLESDYGYDHDQLGIAAVVLLAFPLFFASVFACAIAKLNFQRR